MHKLALKVMTRIITFAGFVLVLKRQYGRGCRPSAIDHVWNEEGTKIVYSWIDNSTHNSSYSISFDLTGGLRLKLWLISLNSIVLYIYIYRLMLLSKARIALQARNYTANSGITLIGEKLLCLSAGCAPTAPQVGSTTTVSTTQQYQVRIYMNLITEMHVATDRRILPLQISTTQDDIANLRRQVAQE